MINTAIVLRGVRLIEDFVFQVQGLDEDNCRAILKMSVSGEVSTISQFALQLVSKKDYDKYSKYLSKYSYL
jgi:G patch domain/KOW motif-containing protein